MNISIISIWNSKNNYGQVLQCYALQRLLMERGHNVSHIRYEVKKNKGFLIKNMIKWILRFVVFPKKTICKYKELKKKENENLCRDFDGFRKKELIWSHVFYSGYDSIKRNPPQADCYITGSDQVWAQLLSNKENEPFYLNFGSPAIRRYSYAASYAMKEYPTHLKPLLKDRLSIFQNISVREADGVKICQDIGLDAVQVLDPTLMLDVDFYRKIQISIHKKNFAFIYSLNITSSEEYHWNEIQPILEKNTGETIVTTGDGYVPAQELFGKSVIYYYAKVGEWLWLIDHSQIVITASFHGIVFCLLFHTPFVYIPLQTYKSGNNRVLSLLKDLNLENRVLYDGVDFQQLYSTQIEWDKVDFVLERMRKKSNVFLDNIN